MDNSLSLMVSSIYLLVISIPIFFVFRKFKRSKSAQDRIIEGLDFADSTHWYRINIASPSHFSKKAKLIGFEARGVLIRFADHVRIVADLPSGERIDKRYNNDDLNLRWVGNKGVGSANMHWIAVGSEDETLMLTADTGINALQSREATADMCRKIDVEFQLPDIARADYALEKNPASLTVVLLFFILLAIAAIDGIFLNNNQLIESGVMEWGIVISAIFSLPVYWFLVRHEVPSRESLTLSMLVVVAIGIVYFPVIKRIDQWLSDEGMQVIEYRLESNASLTPLREGPPKIDYSNKKAYWEQFEEGSIHEFEFIHGPLGLWQLNHLKHGDKIRSFYKERQNND